MNLEQVQLSDDEGPPPRAAYLVVVLPAVLFALTAFGPTGAFGEPLEVWQVIVWAAAAGLTLVLHARSQRQLQPDADGQIVAVA
jgi:hypothetical protein